MSSWCVWVLGVVVVVLCVVGGCSTKAGDAPPPKSGAGAKTEDVPKTLEEAHRVLERTLSADVLREIDEMEREEGMVAFHFGLGMSLRSRWGLRSGSELAGHLRSLGFHHPDDMSSVILGTLWCKRHNKPFRLKERAEGFALYWRSQKDPADDVKDPRDGSAVTWAGVRLGAKNDKGQEYVVHVGRSAVTGEWVAYDCLRGAYRPEGELLERIKRVNSPKR